jgi:hypothetical protein
MMVQFEGQERRMPKIAACLNKYGIKDLDEAMSLCLSRGIDTCKLVKGIQNICFDNAVWAYTIGTAIALKSNAKNPVDAARYIGEGIQAFTVPGSVAELRQVRSEEHTSELQSPS